MMMKKKKKKNSGMVADNNNGTAGGVVLIESSTIIFDIDEYMVIEILSRLPVKSLFRFKCVSKRWCSLIQDSYFVDLHSARSITRPAATFFLSRDYRGFYITFFGSGSTSYDYVIFIGDPSRSFETFGPHFFVQRYYSYYNKHITSTQILDGLLFMSFKDETVWIINPSIRKTIFLTNANIKEEEAIKNKDVVHPVVGIHWMNLEYVVEPKCGFGFDPVTKKYKVICIGKVFMNYVPPQYFLYNPLEGIEHEFEPQLLKIYYRCKVLTIEDDGDCRWRSTDEIPPRRLAGDPVYLNGVLYWRNQVSYDQYYDVEDAADEYPIMEMQVIVSFDLSSERFSVIKIPDFVGRPTEHLHEYYIYRQELYEVDGCLAILENVNTTGPNTIEIWKLVVAPHEAAAAAAKSAAAASCCWVKETILTLSFDWRKEGYLFEVIGRTNQILLKHSKGTSFCYYNRDNYFVDDHETKTKKKTSTCDGEKQLEFTGMAASFTEIQIPARLPGINYRSFYTCTESLWSLNSSNNSSN